MFLSEGESPSRMKVRQDPPAHPGSNGKQGGERFRTILKYPIATDMAMKSYRVTITQAPAGIKKNGSSPIPSPQRLQQAKKSGKSGDVNRRVTWFNRAIS